MSLRLGVPGASLGVVKEVWARVYRINGAAHDRDAF